MCDHFDTERERLRHGELLAALGENMGPARLGHSLRVARTAAFYARRFGLDGRGAWLAGATHDYAREWPPEQVLACVAAADGLVEPEFKAKPLLLHGRAAALLLQRKFGVSDPDVLEAVEHHTLGRPGMSGLAKLLFCADYLEPGRKFTTVPFRRSMRLYCLDCMVCRVVDHCATRHKDIHPLTAAMYAESSRLCAGGACPGPARPGESEEDYERQET